MNILFACEVLEVDINNLTIDLLKKKYHKLSLKYHPDKNNNSEISTEKFKLLNEAFHFLKSEIDINQNQNQNKNEEDNSEYINLLNLFIEGIIKGKGNFISSIIKDIVCGYKEISLKLFENIDREKIITIYNFIFKYKDILHINECILEKIRKIIIDKHKDIMIYVLNPKMVDLFNNNIYKLEINNNLYFVPLWHNELLFDGEDGDIIVKCIPDLPENINIDENNNIIVELNVNFDFSLITDEYIEYELCETKKLNIKLDKLYFKKNQQVVFKKEGITKINENNLYDVVDKSDIIIKITIVE